MVLPIAALMMGMGIKNKFDENKQADEDRARKVKTEDEDRAYTLGQRERTLKLQGKEDALTASMEQAAAPVAVQRAQLPGPTMEGAADLPTVSQVDGRSYATPEAAQSAADTMNTPAASMRRQVKVLQGASKTGEAQQLTDMAKKIEQEGALAFIDRNVQRLPSVDDIRAGRLVDFDLDGVADFNAAGSLRLPEGARGRAKVLKLPNGMEIADFEVVGKDGKVIAPSARRIEALYGYSRAERDRADRDMYQAGENRKHQTTMEGLQGRQVSVAEAAQRSTAQHQRTMEGIARDKATAAEPKAETAESTFDRKTAADIAKDIVKKEAEEAAIGGKQMTAAQVAKRTNDLVQAQFQDHANRWVASTVQRELGAAQADPQAYATAYAKAIKLMPAAELARLGFKAPVGPGKAPPRAAAAGAAPAAPALTGTSMAALQSELQGAPTFGQVSASMGNQPAPAAPAAPVAAAARPAPATEPQHFGELLVKHAMNPTGKGTLADYVKSELPRRQQAVLGAAQQAQNPALTPQIRAVMKARADDLGREAQMMQAFMDANPSLFR
jgi:hypothetical protein